MNTYLIPREIRRIGPTGISVTWSDGRSHTLQSQLLRTNCPCATCKEQRGDSSHAHPLTAGSSKPSLLKVISSTVQDELRLDEIWAVGQYAIGMRWGDQHTTGIYTYDLLRKLGEESSGSGQ